MQPVGRWDWHHRLLSTRNHLKYAHELENPLPPQDQFKNFTGSSQYAEAAKNANGLNVEIWVVESIGKDCRALSSWLAGAA